MSEAPDISKIDPPVCQYCGSVARFRDAQVVYGAGRADFGHMWVCANYPRCDAYVGCHRSSGKPLGCLANPELRKAKKAAHASFDPLWRIVMRRDRISKGAARGRAYRWLATQLGLEPTECHIGMFDVERCRRVVEICTPYLGRRRA